jgi:hypothetical protein
VRNPIRQMFMVNDVQNRWPFALRAAACMAVPALIGWLAGDLASGLMATIGAFTSLYGSGRPYLNRGVHLGVVAVCFALAVAMGEWAAEVPWAGVLTVSVIAMAAVLVCNALAVGPPGAYMFVLACATGTGVASEHLAPWRIGLLVLAGGGFAWLVHMFGALINVRGPRSPLWCPPRRRLRGSPTRSVPRQKLSRGTARRQRCTSRGTCWSLSSRCTHDRVARCIPYARSIMNCTSFSPR